ncbi:MAG: Asp-tRNA(Asn)/Glu-tRNA(Gln) amidotransferase subunit GatC [Desulfarculus sp.]|nr:Asp-tRNA(Asn)/Glu-tRNA(Gln) amidotransferase subunit GatC [Desulfarculus sp.]
MKISPEEVAHVAQLARLRLNPDQTAKLTDELNAILTHMDQLNQLDTSGVPSTNHALDLSGPLREDRVRPSLDRDQALAGAPASDGQSFIVPRVL